MPDHSQNAPESANKQQYYGKEEGSEPRALNETEEKIDGDDFEEDDFEDDEEIETDDKIDDQELEQVDGTSAGDNEGPGNEDDHDAGEDFKEEGMHSQGVIVE